MSGTVDAMHIEGDFTIAAAATLRQQLLEALAADSGPLALDLADVAVIDSAGLQLLLATQRSLAAGERPLQLTRLSPAVREALELFQLHPLLACAPEAHQGAEP